MRILATFALTATLAAAALPAQARISVQEISNYLNSFRSAQAEFTQVNADGSISTGDLTLRRPGRARFDYDAPNRGLVIAGGGQVAVFDPVSNTAPEQYPLSQTPLNLILEEQVNLGRSGMVVRHEGDDTQTAVTLQDPANPQYGNIQLVFTPAPVTLRQWVITDEGGSQTTVILGDMQTDVSTGGGLFNIPLEMQRRGLSN
ncbi:LolA family protein [Jannaschia ovalis]|uniref:Outer membrane lipoprotein carrier protein LolA n=1 Tax=Jannaschia ovalis TaxID=3038773 RepID=A0ABY8L7T2_9RHOB|nr:outer membrane lipoprotein carrier protein LolA [Jannaschia sp. GRR-S6-38]WGH77346.1 outer membrane lipoprotein carrier protein LolA [Jannaschia sp. GRR-S6-38]